jgi:copper chaperone CopZ
VASVRDALEDLAGVTETEIQPGDRNVVVRYDSAKVSVEQMLAALATAGRPAKQG